MQIRTCADSIFKQLFFTYWGDGCNLLSEKFNPGFIKRNLKGFVRGCGQYESSPGRTQGSTVLLFVKGLTDL